MQECRRESMTSRSRCLVTVVTVVSALAVAGVAVASGRGRTHGCRRIILPNHRIDATSSYTQHKVPFSVESWRITQAAGGWFTLATAYADFDGDGQVDVGAMPAGVDLVPFPPVVLTGIGGSALTNVSDQVFEAELPALPTGYRALVADFNRDGRPDLYFASAHVPYPAGNALLVSTPEGKLRWVKELVEPDGFHGGASAADIDNDGDVDIFVSHPDHFLVNAGHGAFTIDYDRVPASLGPGLILAAELVDIAIATATSTSSSVATSSRGAPPPSSGAARSASATRG
jgi:hypothetical protein